MARTYKKTCEECEEVFAARSSRQKLCDSCWGAKHGGTVLRVEYRTTPNGKQNLRTAIIECRECKTEYATYEFRQAFPGLCYNCSLIAGVNTPENLKRLSDLHSGKKLSKEHVAILAESSRTRDCTEETRAKLRAANLGQKRTPEARAKMSASAKKARLRGKQQAFERGGKFGRLYLVAGRGQVKFGASADDRTLESRLAGHKRRYGWSEVIETWNVDPSRGSQIEARVVAAMLAEWDVVGTIIAPGAGNEAVWCDDPAAIVALVESVISQEQ